MGRLLEALPRDPSVEGRKQENSVRRHGYLLDPSAPAHCHHHRHSLKVFGQPARRVFGLWGRLKADMGRATTFLLYSTLAILKILLLLLHIQ